MEDTGQNQTNTGSPDAEPMKNPPEDLRSFDAAPPTTTFEGRQDRYAAERPISVAVFGVLSFVLGGYPFINTYPRLYKVIEPALTGKVSVPGTPWFLLSCLISVGLSIWLLILGIGLLRMTKWARRGSVAYAWVSIGLYVLNLGSTIVMVLSGLMKLPIGSRSFWIVYIHAALIGLIYPLLLLIFMKTEKVKRAFAAVGSV